jgi:hypothetical protein
MLSKRNYFVIVLLFFVVFVLFMMVNVTNDLLTRDIVNERAEQTQIAEASQTIGDSVLDMEKGEASDSVVTNNPAAAIFVQDPEGLYASLLTEWCVYQKYRYQIFEELPAAESLDGFDLILVGDYPITKDCLPLLQAYAAEERDIIITRLPEFEVLEDCPELADFLGIKKCVEKQRELSGIHIFDGFFLGDTRIYTDGDDYGTEDEDTHIKVDYYQLRAGYLVFVQGMLEDDSVDYTELPPVLWRTYTEGSNVYVVNTDVFENRGMLGVLTAFVSQSEEYYLYPVVNAQVISVTDFPLLAQENTEQLRSMYSRSSIELNRDVLWPGVDMILRNYGASYNFFMSAQLDYEDESEPEEDLLSFYYKEIAKQSVALGLSYQQVSDVELEDIIRQNSSFFQSAMPDYSFTAVCVEREQVDSLREASASGKLSSDISLVMTEEKEGQRLFEFLDPDILLASFTQDGFIHESMDDLKMVCLETALGLNNQQVDMRQIFYPESEEEFWNRLSTRWSRGDTYMTDFEVFDNISVYELEDRVRSFLALNYQVEELENGIRLRITSPAEENSFILRLRNHRIGSAINADYEKISDTAYLIRSQGDTVEILFEDADDRPEVLKNVLEVTQ